MKTLNTNLHSEAMAKKARRNKGGQIKEKVLFFVVLVCCICSVLGWERCSMFRWMGECKWRKGTEASRVSGDSFWSQISEVADVVAGTGIRSRVAN